MVNEIIIMALPTEAPDLASQTNVYFTGIGKINAALHLTQLLTKYPDVEKVWNFGTAGGITVSSGLHKCTSFIQRDIKCMPMGYAQGVTPYETEAVIKFKGDGLTCSSGDDFVTDPKAPLLGDIVDMEAYALAKVCKYFGVEFECWKYVSDGANKDSPDAWRENVHKGEMLYREVLERART